MELAKHGFETIVTDKMCPSDRGLVLLDEDGVEHDDVDIIVMQRMMHEQAYNWVRMAQDGGQVIINDVDDWYWGLHPSNVAYKQTDPAVNPDANRDHYKAAILASDIVTVSTPFLAERLTEWGCNVKLVRNAIDVYRWKSEPQKRIPTLGWVGATSHRSEDLETVAEVVGQFVDQHGLKFRHSGYLDGWPHAGASLGVGTGNRVQSEICSIERYPLLFDHIDIGIVPLNKVPFNEAKSAIKGMEYAASGIPFAAQDTGEYKWLFEEHGIGRVASTPDEWRSHLEELLDLDVRVSEADSALKRLEALDISQNWKNWAEVYEGA